LTWRSFARIVIRWSFNCPVVVFPQTEEFAGWALHALGGERGGPRRQGSGAVEVLSHRRGRGCHRGGLRDDK
jgi:hypothetical protein